MDNLLTFDDGNEFGKKIDFAILNGRSIIVNSINDQVISIYPHRIVYVEGELSLVGEDIYDQTLVHLSLENITNVSQLEQSDYRPNFGSMAIDDFISSIRAIDGGEIRLVLKVYQNSRVELNPEFHFIGNPQMVTNPQGDIIWGGSVDPCNDLYEWILSLGDGVEILDPISLKRDFLAFCEEKLKSA